jgi:hypothetical protein
MVFSLNEFNSLKIPEIGPPHADFLRKRIDEKPTRSLGWVGKNLAISLPTHRATTTQHAGGGRK